MYCLCVFQMGANQELHKAFEALRDQLNSQKDSVQKMDHKIQKRERELKEKIQVWTTLFFF